MNARGRQDLKATSSDRRRFGRRDTFKPATIMLGNGETVACVVVNLSAGGALLQGADCVDNAFDLLITEDDLIVACRVAHRTEAKIGVEFIRSPRRASRLGTASHERARLMVRSIFGN